MKIGIVSDSHGKAALLRKAVAALLEAGAEAIVHCGDVGNSECVDVLAKAPVPAYAVAGNMDRHPERLKAQAERAGVHFSQDTILLRLAGETYLAATHGNRPETMKQLLEDDRFRYVCHGHTHLPRNEKIGQVRVINPGALHHAHPPTAALLDSESDTVEFIQAE